jgi:preprotein translocase subunit SecD
MRRGLVASLAVIVLVAGGSFAAVMVSGTAPELGLDLQGGASVVLRPSRPVPNGVLDQSIEVIRNRVDALGVAEPDISRQGKNVVVQLPGVRNRDRALELVGQTAELRFRPVLGAALGLSQVEPADDAEALPTTAEEEATTTTTAPTTTTTLPGGRLKATSRADDKPDREVILPEISGGEVHRYWRLGPAELTGEILKSATAQFDQNVNTWLVRFTLTDEGSNAFDQLATKYVGRQLAIVLDGVVKSAPGIEEEEFGGQGQITGDFTEREAKDLALVLRFGALPVELKPQTVQTVSASLGRDSLRAGITAGLVGLGLVLLYMVLYYRALGVVVLFGLCVWGMLMWSIVAVLGRTSGLALSLAGAVGIIVSLGVTVDSYVVYFERLKDEIRAGKTIRSSVDRGFSRAFRTILTADISSFIGAALLYLLTVGSVRGFAFFLGLSTILDVVVAYLFTRPLVVLLGRNRTFTEARWLGVARGLGGAARQATS